MKKKKEKRKPAPVPVGHDYRGEVRDGHLPEGDCRTPDGISGYWGDTTKQD